MAAPLAPFRLVLLPLLRVLPPPLLLLRLLSATYMTYIYADAKPPHIAVAAPVMPVITPVPPTPVMPMIMPIPPAPVVPGIMPVPAVPVLSAPTANSLRSSDKA
ncbi:hypothetical protein C0992_004929 [Termitomyces sp. T32_za158]|nr:hypothetical protein C0992_004929 [Termitomyces sp. T32_za158]